MESLIEQNKQSLAEICRKYHVARLDVFGSAATGEMHQSSDIDFLVEFTPEADANRFDIFFDLRRALQTLFQRPIDLIEPGGLRNPYFIKSVNETRKPVYAAP